MSGLTDYFHFIVLEIDPFADQRAFQESRFGLTPLHSAAIEGYPEKLQEFLEAGEMNINELDSEGEAPLHGATMLDNLECVKLLVDAGANLDVIDHEGYTPPPHWAAENGQHDCFMELLRRGANPLIVNHFGDTPLHTAFLREVIPKDRDLASLIQRISGLYPPCRILDELRRREIRGRASVIHKNNLEIFNTKNKDGDTVFHLAARLELLHSARALFSGGAFFQILNNNGETPRGLLSRSMSIQFFERFLAYIFETLNKMRPLHK